MFFKKNIKQRETKFQKFFITFMIINEVFKSFRFL